MVGFRQPLDIQIVVQCRQPFRRTLAGDFRYPSLFRVPVFGSLWILPVALRRLRDCAGPFPTPRLRAAPFAGFPRSYEPVKTPATPPPVLPLSVAPKYLELAPAVSLQVVGKPGRRGQDVVRPVHPFPVFTPQDAHGSPMFPGNPRCLCRALRPRPDLGPSPQRDSGTAPDARTTRAPATIMISRLIHTAEALAVYASCRHC